VYRVEKELFKKEKINTYAIVDSAVNEEILRYINRRGVERKILYRDRVDRRDLSRKAPYLVELHKDNVDTHKLLKEGYGHNWGCFVLSYFSIKELSRHFTNYTKIYSEVHEQNIYMRFYDPRTINKYLNILNKEESLEFFSKISTLYVEKVDEPQILLKYNYEIEKQRIQKEEIILEEEI